MCVTATNPINISLEKGKPEIETARLILRMVRNGTCLGSKLLESRIWNGML